MANISMRMITLLNDCYYLKFFVYQNEKFEDIAKQKSLVVEIVPRKNSHPICSVCNRHCSVYDHVVDKRLFQFIPAWGYQVYFRYQMRRVNCADCGIKVERVPLNI